MNIKTNDKIYIKYGDNDIPFIGLEESLKEYNEENINTIVSNVLDLLDKEKMTKENYYKIWNSQQGRTQPSSIFHQQQHPYHSLRLLERHQCQCNWGRFLW